MEGILYRMRTGCPWRDVPESFCDWSAIYRRFNLWSKKDVLMRLFNSLRYEPDLDWEFIDGSIVKAHQHSTGARTKDNEGIGKSVTGNTTKIHMTVDSYGLPIGFHITGGEVHDSKAAPTLIDMCQVRIIPLQTEAMIVKHLENKYAIKMPFQLSRKRKISRLVMMISIGVYINTVI